MLREWYQSLIFYFN